MRMDWKWKRGREDGWGQEVKRIWGWVVGWNTILSFRNVTQPEWILWKSGRWFSFSGCSYWRGTFTETSHFPKLTNGQRHEKYILRLEFCAATSLWGHKIKFPIKRLNSWRDASSLRSTNLGRHNSNHLFRSIHWRRRPFFTGFFTKINCTETIRLTVTVYYDELTKKYTPTDQCSLFPGRGAAQ